MRVTVVFQTLAHDVSQSKETVFSLNADANTTIHTLKCHIRDVMKTDLENIVLCLRAMPLYDFRTLGYYGIDADVELNARSVSFSVVDKSTASTKPKVQGSMRRYDDRTRLFPVEDIMNYDVLSAASKSSLNKSTGKRRPRSAAAQRTLERSTNESEIVSLDLSHDTWSQNEDEIFKSLKNLPPPTDIPSPRKLKVDREMISRRERSDAISLNRKLDKMLSDLFEQDRRNREEGKAESYQLDIDLRTQELQVYTCCMDEIISKTLAKSSERGWVMAGLWNKTVKLFEKMQSDHQALGQLITVCEQRANLKEKQVEQLKQKMIPLEKKNMELEEELDEKRTECVRHITEKAELRFTIAENSERIKELTDLAEFLRNDESKLDALKKQMRQVTAWADSLRLKLDETDERRKRAIMSEICQKMINMALRERHEVDLKAARNNRLVMMEQTQAIEKMKRQLKGQSSGCVTVDRSNMTNDVKVLTPEEDENIRKQLERVVAADNILQADLSSSTKKSIGKVSAAKKVGHKMKKVATRPLLLRGNLNFDLIGPSLKKMCDGSIMPPQILQQLISKLLWDKIRSDQSCDERGRTRKELLPFIDETFMGMHGIRSVVDKKVAEFLHTMINLGDDVHYRMSMFRKFLGFIDKKFDKNVLSYYLYAMAYLESSKVGKELPAACKSKPNTEDGFATNYIPEKRATHAVDKLLNFLNQNEIRLAERAVMDMRLRDVTSAGDIYKVDIDRLLEYLVGRFIVEYQRQEDKLQELFRSADRDGDGDLSFNEWRELLTTVDSEVCKSLSQTEVAEIYQEAADIAYDETGGIVNESVFVKVCKRHNLLGVKFGKTTGFLAEHEKNTSGNEDLSLLRSMWEDMKDMVEDEFERFKVIKRNSWDHLQLRIAHALFMRALQKESSPEECWKKFRQFTDRMNEMSAIFRLRASGEGRTESNAAKLWKKALAGVLRVLAMEKGVSGDHEDDTPTQLPTRGHQVLAASHQPKSGFVNAAQVWAPGAHASSAREPSIRNQSFHVYERSQQVTPLHWSSASPETSFAGNSDDPEPDFLEQYRLHSLATRKEAKTAEKKIRLEKFKRDKQNV